MTQLTENQSIQEDQYEFPYHYADLISDRHKFFKFIEMLDLQRIVKEKVRSFDRSLILDAGCGDGRLCYELRNEPYKIIGVDYSEKALGFARAFNPGAEFHQQDLTNATITDQYDVIILMETLEHFIPDQIPTVIATLSKLLKDDGKLLITVPSKNLKLADKHYQHFDRESLTETVKSHFKVEEIRGYYKKGFHKSWFNFLRKLGNLFYPFRKDSSLAQKYLAYYKKYYEKNVSVGTPEECYGLIGVFTKNT